ncbi:MAG: cell division protein FtsQ/DivIB [Kiritimatiellia bacterium]
MPRSSRDHTIGNRYRQGSGNVRLYVRGGKTRGRQEHPLWTGVLLVVVALLVAGAVGYAAILFAGNALFAENHRFAIKAIEVQGGAVKTEKMVLEYLEHVGIAPGANLFSFSMRELTDVYLERNPLVRQVRVERVLPDALRFSVWERQPLARLGQHSTLVVDREGYVFRMLQRLGDLPVIIEKGETVWSPGDTVFGMLPAALEVLDVCDDPRVGLRVLGVDVRNPEYLLIHVLTTDGIKEARLSWLDMGQNTEASRRDLVMRLARLRQVAHEDRSGRSLFDVTLPGRIYVR